MKLNTEVDEVSSVSFCLAGEYIKAVPWKGSLQQSRTALRSLRPQVLVFSSFCKSDTTEALYSEEYLLFLTLVGKNNAKFSYTPRMKKLFSFKLSHHITLQLKSVFWLCCENQYTPRWWRAVQGALPHLHRRTVRMRWPSEALGGPGEEIPSAPASGGGPLRNTM